MREVSPHFAITTSAVVSTTISTLEITRQLRLKRLELVKRLLINYQTKLVIGKEFYIAIYFDITIGATLELDVEFFCPIRQSFLSFGQCPLQSNVIVSRFETKQENLL